MMALITRFALVSLIGLLLDPGAFKQHIPSAEQVAHFQHQIDNAPGLRKMIEKRIAAVQSNMKEVAKTVKALDVAYLDVRNHVREDARDTDDEDDR